LWYTITSNLIECDVLNVRKDQQGEKEMKIAFIGGGNMAKAMITGIISSGLLPGENIIVSDCDASKADTTDNQTAVDFADYIFLTVKPQHYDSVIAELVRTENKVFITVAPGIKSTCMSGKVIRTMPNTPALVGEGVTAVCRGKGVTDDEFEFVKKLLSSFSAVHEFSEPQMDDVVALSGSSPAYVYMFIEAMANYSAKCGIDFDVALKMAAQTLRGAAKMVLESDESPSVLCDRVCSKGGTTIKAVEKLQELDFSDVIEQAMDACTKRVKELAAQ